MKEKQSKKKYVMVKLSETELAMITSILEDFFWQGDNIYKSCGINTKKLENQFIKLNARLDAIFWENFDEGAMLEKMWGPSLEKARYDE